MKLSAIATSAVAVTMLALAGCGASPEDEARDKVIQQQILAKEQSSPSSTPTPSYGTPRTVRMLYELEGDGVITADITMKTPTGTTQQQDIDVPMMRKSGLPGLLITYDRGDFVYISAQIKSGSGSLTCRITNPDTEVVISTNTASGEYAIATCEGSAS